MRRRTMIVIGVASLLVATAVYSARQVKTPAEEPIKTPKTTKATKPKQPPKPAVVQQQQPPAPRPKVDIVVALDTSSSMDGLIDSARQKLWDIVNEVAKAKPTPRLRVGLVTFGNDNMKSEGGWVEINSELTTDLDSIYEKLMALTTNGGTEYVGRAVWRSVKDMGWDKDPATLRQIYVAGNESANQDPKIRAAKAVKLARKHDIYVNAIYCGGETDSDAASWRRVAGQGSGAYASIDQNNGTVAIASPYDSKINALSARLNSTYVAYGAEGTVAHAKQAAQDRNAARVHSSTGASRALAKATKVYHNPKWDLVDARKSGKLKTIRRRSLPAHLRGKTKEEIKVYIDKKEKERKEINKQIVELSKKRSTYVAVEMKKKGKTANKAFDTAVKKALRRQAKAKKINFK